MPVTGFLLPLPFFWASYSRLLAFHRIGNLGSFAADPFPRERRLGRSARGILSSGRTVLQEESTCTIKYHAIFHLLQRNLPTADLGIGKMSAAHVDKAKLNSAHSVSISNWRTPDNNGKFGQEELGAC